MEGVMLWLGTAHSNTELTKKIRKKYQKIRFSLLKNVVFEHIYSMTEDYLQLGVTVKIVIHLIFADTIYPCFHC